MSANRKPTRAKRLRMRPHAGNVATSALFLSRKMHLPALGTQRTSTAAGHTAPSSARSAKRPRTMRRLYRAARSLRLCGGRDMGGRVLSREQNSTQARQSETCLPQEPPRRRAALLGAQPSLFSAHRKHDHPLEDMEFYNNDARLGLGEGIVKACLADAVGAPLADPTDHGGLDNLEGSKSMRWVTRARKHRGAESRQPG